MIDNVVLQRDVFSCEQKFDLWKSAYLSVFGVHLMLETQIQHLKGTFFEKSLRQLKRISNKIIRRLKKSGTNHGKWAGASDECNKILTDFRKECKPVIKELITCLDPSNEFRQNVEQKLKLEE
jgi:hypothetical protein